MPMDFDPLEQLVAALVTTTLGANDRNPVSCLAQGARLLPDAPIKRHRQVFDDDANSDRRSGHILDTWASVFNGEIGIGTTVQSLREPRVVSGDRARRRSVHAQTA